MVAEGENTNTQNGTQEPMPTLPQRVQQYSPLLQQQYMPLGATIFMALRRMHENDKYTFRIMEFAYWCYLKKHPDSVREYIETLETQDYMVGSNLIVRIANAIKDKIKYIVIKVNNTQEETRNTITRLTSNPSYQFRDLSVDIIQQNFNCDESGIQELRDYLQSINSYTGSMLSVGMNNDGSTVLIVHVFSIE